MDFVFRESGSDGAKQEDGLIKSKKVRKMRYVTDYIHGNDTFYYRTLGVWQSNHLEEKQKDRLETGSTTSFGLHLSDCCGAFCILSIFQSERESATASV